VVASFLRITEMSPSTIFRWIAASVTQLISVVLLLSILVGVYTSYFANREAYRGEKARAENERRQAVDEIADRCNVILNPGETLRGCLSSELKAYEDKANTDKDLEAQQDMAFWAEALFWLTAVGAAISAFGIFFVWLSLRQTRQAISTDREVGHAQVRAYISTEVQTPIIQPRALPRHEFKIENTGQSPAYSVAYIAGFRLLSKPLTASNGHLGIIADGQEMPKISLGSNRSMTVEAIGTEEISSEDLAKVIAGESYLYFFARVFYEDVFKQSHETSFCGEMKFEPLPGPEVNGLKPYRSSMQIDQKRSYAN